MTASSLTQSRLKELLHYNPDTGIFTRLISRGSVGIGSVAGYIKNSGYIQINIDGRSYLAHRLAFLYMDGKFPKNEVDHINHVRHHNKWTNLREATSSENSKNRSISRNNTSGVTGVTWRKNNMKWAVFIWANYKNIHLGFYPDYFDACCVRKSAENKHGFHENHG